MNKIEIFAPRWHDRKVLIGNWKIGAENLIEITATKADGTRHYPHAFKVSGAKLMEYPAVRHKYGVMREVPLDVILESDHEVS